ncbi:MAG: molybdate ABC transporter permease subunit, partial [Burkholderiaceae bacterium]
MTLSPEEWTTIFLSLRVALLATLMCLPVGLGLAWLLARKEFWGKSALNSIIHLPLVLPPVVTGYLLLIAFGKRGVIGAFLESSFCLVFAFRWTGAALAAALMALPLMVRAIRLSMEAIDQRLEGAAATLGASPFRVFTTVTLPLAAPGILVGTILTFVKALGEFGATITFVSNIPNETQTLSLAIYSLLQTPNGDAAAWRLIVLS